MRRLMMLCLVLLTVATVGQLTFWRTSSANAATITANACGEKCLGHYADGVVIDLVGRIAKGDLENIKKQYAEEAFFACVNRLDPGHLVKVPVDQVEQWQKEWAAKRPNGPTEAEKRAAERVDKKCASDPTLPVRPGNANGVLRVKSPGGDLSEAMAIGRWVRQNRFGVIVGPRCASACVWVLAAGLFRWIWSDDPDPILIHRPYLMSDNSNAGEHIRKLLQDSKIYFEEMGVPPDLAERMFSTPPAEATALNQNDIAYYRLEQNSLEFQEELDSRNARTLGISKDEYIRRMQHLNNLNKLYPCSRVVNWSGVSSYLDLPETSKRKLIECENNHRRAVGLIRE